MTMSPMKKTWAGLVLGLSIFGSTLAAAPAYADANGTYVTQKGDTFWLVANKLHISTQALQDANPSILPMNVYPGLTLKIPGGSVSTSHPAVSGTYLMKAGDTFWIVSQQLNIPLQTLLNANPSISPTNVYAGLTIKLPSSSSSPTPKQGNTVTTASGNILAYSRELTAVATAYTDSPAENGGWGGFDYYGNALKFGTIAVDPNVIPLGSKLYVTGYAFNGMPRGFVATASDIGSAIKGNRIDIFIPSSIGNAVNFGMQHVKLYVLK